MIGKIVQLETNPLNNSIKEELLKKNRFDRKLYD